MKLRTHVSALVLALGAIGPAAVLTAAPAEAAASCSFNATKARVTVQLPAANDEGFMTVGRSETLN